MDIVKNEKYIIRNKYLAFALSFLGFNFYTQDARETNKQIYIFDSTSEFLTALTKLTEVKKEYGKSQP